MAINDNELYALKGKQVKDLAQRLSLKGDKPLTGSDSPTTSTEGEVGQLYIDNTNAKLYICTEIVEESGEPDSYVWQEVGAGGGVGVTALTSADYNWNYQTQTTTNPNCVAVWLLDSGVYTIAEQSLKVANQGSNISSAVSENLGEMFMIAMGAPGVTGVSLAKCYTKFCDRALAPQSISGGTQYLRTWEYMSFFNDNGVKIADRAVLFDDSLNDLSGNTLTGPLSAVKGKEIEDLVNSLVIKNAGAPTTSTVGTVGQLLEDTNNGKLYICTDATNPYVWTEVGAGGGTTVYDSIISLTNNGSALDSFTVNASSNKTIALGYPIITMTSTDPGEGSPLAANNFIAVYSAS